MRIAICSSMVFSEKMIEVKGLLQKMGHTATYSIRAPQYVGHTMAEMESFTIRDKNDPTMDVITEFYDEIKNSDAILVL